MMVQGLVAHLAADTSVAALVSNGAAVRIFPHVIPQKLPSGSVVPCLVYELAGEERDRDYCGTSRLIRSRWRLKSFAPRMADAMNLAAAVRDALVDFSGPMGASPHTVEVRDCALESVLSFEDMEPGLFRVEQTYLFWIVEE